jgi:hypothetical protein
MSSAPQPDVTGALAGTDALAGAGAGTGIAADAVLAGEVGLTAADAGVGNALAGEIGLVLAAGSVLVFVLGTGGRAGVAAFIASKDPASAAAAAAARAPKLSKPESSLSAWLLKAGADALAGVGFEAGFVAALAGLLG